MSGIVKRKYAHESMTIKKAITRQIKLISEILPLNYDKKILLELYKEYYAHDWEILRQRYELYKNKDEHLLSVGKKKRYYPESPDDFILNHPTVRLLLSENRKKIHRANFNLLEVTNKQIAFKEKRNNRIFTSSMKSELVKKKMQDVEPLYADLFIFAYHKRGSTTHDKLEVINELKKYNCEKTIQFLYKLNDSERNSQLRQEAFNLLQKMGVYVKLRKGFKGKRKQYMIETDNFIVTPKDLSDQIDADNIQNKKEYDYFISHSYQDNELVWRVVSGLNKLQFNSYCDWSSDNDFLKRQLLSEYTEKVLKKRIEQSKFVLFIRTENSCDINNELKSPWIEMELKYASQLGKKIYCIDLLNEGDTIFDPIFFNEETDEINFHQLKIKG